jgi:rhodanese-related sulfurtransferase
MRTIDPKEAQKLQADGATIVDVREEDERALERIAGSLHMPMSQLLQKIDNLRRFQTVIFQCATGGRSMMAAGFAEMKGLSNVLDMEGGIEAWKDAGLPVEH